MILKKHKRLRDWYKTKHRTNWLQVYMSKWNKSYAWTRPFVQIRPLKIGFKGSTQVVSNVHVSVVPFTAQARFVITLAATSSASEWLYLSIEGQSQGQASSSTCGERSQRPGRKVRLELTLSGEISGVGWQEWKSGRSSRVYTETAALSVSPAPSTTDEFKRFSGSDNFESGQVWKAYLLL